MIPYGRQDITQTDIDAVVGVLQSDFLTQGPMVPRFEQSVAQHVGASHALAVNSATSALHIACLALGLFQLQRQCLRTKVVGTWVNVDKINFGTAIQSAVS